MYKKVTNALENKLYLNVFEDAWKFEDTEYNKNKIERYIMLTEDGEVFGAFAYAFYDLKIGSTIESLYPFKEKVSKINDKHKVTIEIAAFAVKKEHQGFKHFMQSVYYMNQELMNLNCDYCIGVTEPKFARLLKKVYRRKLSILTKEKTLIAQDDHTEWVAMIADLKPVFYNIDEYPLLKYGTSQTVQTT